MESNPTPSKGRLWTSYILQGSLVLLFLMDALNKLFGTDIAAGIAFTFGYPPSSVLYLGIYLSVSTVLFALPKTSVLGATLLTAWLGGAVASHYIHHDPATVFLIPMLCGTLVWVSLWLRNDMLRKLFPFVTKD